MSRSPSLNFVILVPILAVLLICMSLGAGALYMGISHIMRNNLEQNVNLTESFLLKVTPELIWNFDTDAMTSYADNVMKNGEFTKVSFFNEKGAPFVTRQSGTNSSTKSISRMQDIVVDGAKIGSFALEYSTSQIESKLMVLLVEVIIGMLVLLAALSLLIRFTLSNTTKPIIKLSSMFSLAASEGDLTQSIPLDKSKEIGTLGRALNEFLGRIRSTLVKVQSLGVIVKNHAAAIGANAVRVEELVNSQQMASNEISLAIKDSANNLNDLNALTQTAASQLENMVTMAQQTNEVMQKLEDTSAQIQEVIGVITAVAESTNLLALNAAIEAARAGDAGRGFSVVAEEVKKLSVQTMQSTAKISETINALKRDIGATQKQVHDITGAISGVQHNIVDVAQATERQSATMEEVSNTIISFLEKFATTRNAMDENQSHIAHLIEEVESLDKSISVFKVAK